MHDNAFSEAEAKKFSASLQKPEASGSFSSSRRMFKVLDFFIAQITAPASRLIDDTIAHAVT
jgi:hypothetical protein